MEMTVGDLRKLIAGKPSNAVVPVHVKYGEVEIDTIFVRIDSTKARRRPFGIHLGVSLVAEKSGDCERCNSSLDEGGFCLSETCPFSDHAQDCPVGWAGHPDHPNVEGIVTKECTCGGKPAKSNDEIGAELLVVVKGAATKGQIEKIESIVGIKHSSVNALASNTDIVFHLDTEIAAIAMAKKIDKLGFVETTNVQDMQEGV